MSLRRTFLISSALIALGYPSAAQTTNNGGTLTIQTHIGSLDAQNNIGALFRSPMIGLNGTRIFSSTDSQALLTGKLPQNRISGIRTVTISPEGPPNGESVITSTIQDSVNRLNLDPDQAKESSWSAQQDIAAHLAAVQQAQGLSGPFGVYNMVEGAFSSNAVTPQDVFGAPPQPANENPGINTSPSTLETLLGPQQYPGIYVQVIDGLINLSNTGGTQNFAAGQFGYAPGNIRPPVIVPMNPGIIFAPPPAFTQRTQGAPTPPEAPLGLPTIEFSNSYPSPGAQNTSQDEIDVIRAQSSLLGVSLDRIEFQSGNPDPVVALPPQGVGNTLAITPGNSQPVTVAISTPGSTLPQNTFSGPSFSTGLSGGLSGPFGGGFGSGIVLDGLGGGFGPGLIGGQGSGIGGGFGITGLTGFAGSQWRTGFGESLGTGQGSNPAAGSGDAPFQAPVANNAIGESPSVSEFIEVNRPVSGITNDLAREIEALRQIVATDPQALTRAIGPALDRLKEIARRSPEGIAAFPDLAADLFSATTAALDSWVSSPEIRSALNVAIATAITGEISQLSGQVAPEILAEALISVAKNLTDYAARSLTGPNPDLAAVLGLIADSIPPGTNPDAVSAIREIAGAVSTGDIGKLQGNTQSGPKSASAS